MDYQHYKDALETIQPDVREYIVKAVNRQNDSATTMVNRKYLDILERESATLESIDILDFLNIGDWKSIYKHMEENYNERI